MYSRKSEGCQSVFHVQGIAVMNWTESLVVVASSAVKLITGSQPASRRKQNRDRLVDVSQAAEVLESRELLSNIVPSGSHSQDPLNGTRWLFNNQQVQVYQGGRALVFVNENGQQSAGEFQSANTVTASTWGITGTLTGDGRIDWSNGTSWTKMSNLWGTWMIGSNTTSIDQVGTTLTFTNERGRSVAGVLNSNTQVTATGWGGLTGTVVSETKIVWSNGSVWDRVPDISGFWKINGSYTRIDQTGTSVTFVNERGGSANGVFTTATTLRADGWGGLIGNLTNNGTIVWGNQSSWWKQDVSGWWQNASGAATQIFQRGYNVAVAREDGAVSVGTFTTATQITANDFAAGLTGNINVTSNRLQWSDGSVWTRLPTLSGTWEITSFGQATRVYQVGADLVFVNRLGGVSRGTVVGIISSVQNTWALAATDWGNLQATLWGNQIQFANGTTWQAKNIDFHFGSRGKGPFMVGV